MNPEHWQHSKQLLQSLLFHGGDTGSIPVRDANVLSTLRDLAISRASRNIQTGTLSILLHVYGVLPPHRNMGFLALMVGAGYGLVMLFVYQWNEKPNLAL